jgi:ankyrin repeat protein
MYVLLAYGYFMLLRVTKYHVLSHQGTTCLIMASENGEHDVVKALLAGGAGVHSTNHEVR